MRLATRLLSARGPFLADSLGVPLTSQQKKSAQQTSGSEDKAMQGHASKQEKKPQQKFYEEVRYAPMLIQSDPKRSRPLFISHLKWITGQTQLKKYFGKYGDLKDVSLYFDAETGIHKGYASVTFENPKTLEKVLKDSPHVIDGDIINVGTEAPRTHKGAKKLNLVNQPRRHSISS